MGALSEVQWMDPAKKNFNDFKQRSLSLRRLYDKYKLTYRSKLWKTTEKK